MTRIHLILAGLALMVAGCKPAAFATHEADLMRSPPPLLPGDANAFWNDTASGTYGEITVGAGLYRRGPALCRTARVTSLNSVTGIAADRTLLYCSGPDGVYRLDPSLSCRMAGSGPALTCRNPEGDDVTLPPA